MYIDNNTTILVGGIKVKKYNLSQIITAAWNYVKYLKVSLSEGLKKLGSILKLSVNLQR